MSTAPRIGFGKARLTREWRDADEVGATGFRGVRLGAAVREALRVRGTAGATKRASQIAQLEERLKQLKAREQAVEARRRTLESRRARKADTRRKILVGAVVLARVERGEIPEAELRQWLDRALVRDDDRALFELS